MTLDSGSIAETATVAVAASVAELGPLAFWKAEQ